MIPWYKYIFSVYHGMLGLPYQVYFGFFFSHAAFLWKAVIHDFISINRRTFLGAKLDLKSVTTRPLVLNSDSDATLEACTVRTSLAIFAKEGYLPVPSFNHQFLLLTTMS